MYHIHINQNKAVLVILVSDRADVRAKKITRNKTKRNINIRIKRSIHQDNIAILSVSTKHGCKLCKAKLIELKEKQANPQLFLETSISFSPQLTEQPDGKSAKKTRQAQQHYLLTECNQYLQNTLPTMAKYIFLSSTHGTYTKTDHILSHKTNHNKFNRSKRTECVL